MFCTNCGAKISGKFCSECGEPVTVPDTPESQPTTDWTQEFNYEKLVILPKVKEMIAKHSSMSKKTVSGEEFLAIADKIIPLPISLEKLTSVAQPISARLGIKTGKERSQNLSIPIGTAIVSALCSLARHGQVLQQVHQFEDGCLLESSLPSDMWSFAGTLYVTLRKTQSGTSVDCATHIEGQLFDWGKSNRCIDELFADIQSTPA